MQLGRLMSQQRITIFDLASLHITDYLGHVKMIVEEVNNLRAYITSVMYIHILLFQRDIICAQLHHLLHYLSKYAS